MTIGLTKTFSPADTVLYAIALLYSETLSFSLERWGKEREPEKGESESIYNFLGIHWRHTHKHAHRHAHTPQRVDFSIEKCADLH